MENTYGAVGEISNGSRGEKRGREEGTRYTRFTEEQSEALEKVFAECPFPDQIQLTRISVTEPILSGLTIKQLRVWFQNRRYRDRQRKGNEELVEENKRLVTIDNSLKEQENGLQRQIDQLTLENASVRNRILSLTSRIATSDVSREPVSVVSQWTSAVPDNNKSLHSLAEEIKNEFLIKAIGTEENPAPLIEAAPESNLDADLAVLITESYRSMLGVEMLGLNLQTTDSVAQLVQNHQYAILCFSFSSVPVIFYANEAALDMLGTTTDKLQHIPVDKILGGSGNVSLDSILPTIMQQGFTILPSGCYISETNNRITYDQAILWQVRLFDGSIHCLAAAFTDCMSFM